MEAKRKKEKEIKRRKKGPDFINTKEQQQDQRKHKVTNSLMKILEI